MNQATVIAGFCEIIENLINKRHLACGEGVLPALHKVDDLVRAFNATLSLFRDECVLTGIDRELLQALDPASEITGYLSESCRIHFSVLDEISGEIEKAACSLTPADIGNEAIGMRYTFISEAAVKLHGLFERPVAYLQRALREHSQEHS